MVYGDVVTHSGILLLGHNSVWSGLFISCVSGKGNWEDVGLEIMLDPSLKSQFSSDLLPSDMPDLLMVLQLPTQQHHSEVFKHMNLKNSLLPNQSFWGSQCCLLTATCSRENMCHQTSRACGMLVTTLAYLMMCEFTNVPRNGDTGGTKGGFLFFNSPGIRTLLERHLHREWCWSLHHPWCQWRLLFSAQRMW